MTDEQRVVSASLEIAAPADAIFELIADPANQPSWDGNDNLGSAEPGQRVRAVGDVFTMTLAGGAVRENHVFEFEEGRRIAWRPSEVGAEPPGHVWRWELQPRDDGATLVTHTYDWTQLTEKKRLRRARVTLPENLMASLEGLAAAVASPVGLPALFAGISVADYDAAQEWYTRLFGRPPSFHPNDEEAVWEVAESRSVYVQHRPDHAGHALVTLFVDDLTGLVDGITERGLEPHLDETYDNGVRKVTYRDPEGNELGFGGA
ncbi:MAG: hypothetical protein QOD98_337 [Nocardioidaceae bacterium]|jgi:uncharacterized protein YndB with AHSA1/START domain/catechol 2,3-dioxygenase-like lactoylglutathione lyase family enzyme|nr:hypothetical protein [Nocardioidaceae bacterium]